MSAKKVSAVKKAEGSGAEVKRLFPNRNHNGFHDPFVLLDEFFVEPPNEFAPHEHRGFEAITYMLEGHFTHEDNLNNKATVGPGGIQAFNAGKGIIHSEKPGEEGLSRGIQLWVNLPQDKKKSEPNYQFIKSDQIREEETEDLIIREIAGDNSDLKLNTKIKYLDLKVKKDTTFKRNLNSGEVAVFYLIKGKIEGEYNLESGEGLLVEAGEEILLSLKKDSRLIFLRAKAHNQDIKLKGSFVE